jgi:uncharacterized protein (TIGR01370 family)
VSTLKDKLAQTKTFALALSNAGSVATMSKFDLVVVDGETSSAFVDGMHANGKLVLAYVSVGTLEPYRPWFKEAVDKGYALKYWPAWNEYYAKISEPGLRQILLNATNGYLAKGFDGLFLDNTDLVVEYPDQKAGMMQMIADLDAQLNGRLLFAQNGDEVVENWAQYLEGWNHESVSTSYNFDTKTYIKQNATETNAILGKLRAFKSRGIFVTTTDYVAASDTAGEALAVQNACSVGAVPFVSNIELNRIPATPQRCS